jgi:outer membrane protein assembly factor BamD
MAELMSRSLSYGIGRACTVALLAGAASLGGCESFEIGGARHVTLTYTDDAKAAYNEAMGAYRSHDWEDARALFGEVKKLFPYSRYARLAELRMADINFEQEKYSDASSSYRQFILSHKSDPDVPYARYRITVSLFRDIDDTFFLPPAEERDQATTQDAYKEIRSFIRDYPASRFLQDELYMYDVVVGRLVRHELYAARYYARTDDFPAALARIDYALRTYPGSTLEPEALVLKGETFLKMKRIADARSVLETVTRDYQGPFVRTAQSFLDEIKTIESRPPRPRRPEDEKGL